MSYPVLQPESLSDLTFLEQVSAFSPDIFVVVAFRILPQALLQVPPQGAINLHPSLLPSYRGAAPIQHCLLNGDTSTGITTIAITGKIDAGDIILQEEVPIQPGDDFGSLSVHLAERGAEMVVRTLDLLQGGQARPVNQASISERAVTPAPKIKPGDLVIDWNTSATQIANQIRAFSPRPGARTTLEGQGLKLFVPAVGTAKGPPGELLAISATQLEIGAGTGSLLVGELQMEGRKRMAIEDFLRGKQLVVGQKFG